MAQVPYDIWLLIAHFLPRQTLVQLYSVNRALLNIALDEQYRDARVYYHEDAKTRKLLRALKFCSPNTAHRVRSLLLRPHVFGRLVNKRSSKRKDSVILLQSLTSFSNISNLDLQCCYLDDYTAFKSTFSYVHPALQAYSSTLQTLSLQIPLEAYRDMNLSSLTFSNLRRLTVHVFMAYLTTDHESLLKNDLANFINGQKMTLEALAISGLDVEYNYRIASVFANLETFPRLIKLDVAFFVLASHYTFTTGIETFLSAHSSQIKVLKFRTEPLMVLGRSANPWSMILSRPLFKTALPRLTSLTLRLTNLLKAQDIAAYISQYKDTLTEFALKDKALLFPEVDVIVSAFQGGNLQSLSLITKLLGPDLLSLLSGKLPDLQRLNVAFDCWTGRGYQDHQATAWQHYRHIPSLVNAFLEASLDSEVYTTWRLRHLDVRVLYNSDGKLDRCHNVLVGMLPNVETFNGYSPEEFLKQPQPWT